MSAVPSINRDTPNMLEWALSYARGGLPVFPVHTPIPGGCSCGKPNCGNVGKHPRTEHGWKDATTDPDQIRDWWSRWPDANIGMPTGKVSGLVVVDCDPRNGGPTDRGELRELYGTYDETAEGNTGGGGLHIFLKYPGPVETVFQKGVDVQSDGVYVVMAPSLHQSGKRYAFDGLDGAKALQHVADFPEHWVHRRSGEPSAKFADEIPFKIPKGKQHTTLVSLAGSMRRRGAEVEEIYAALKVMNQSRCAEPGPDRNIHLIAESVCRYAPGAVSSTKLREVEQSTASGRIRAVEEIASIRSYAGRRIDFIIPGILAAGTITAFTGDAGAGRSSLVAAMCATTARGESFAGRSTLKRPVLYLDRENPLPVVLERFDRLGLEDGPNFKIWGGWADDEPPCPDSPIIREWVAKCDPKPVIVVDSFIAFHEGSENDSADMRKTLQGLRHLADLGATVIAIHHSGKGESTREYRGSSDFKAGIDVGYVVVNLNPDPSRLGPLRLKTFKARFVVETELMLQYRNNRFESDERGPVKTVTDLLRELLIRNAGIGVLEFSNLASEKRLGRDKARDFINSGILNRTILVGKGPRNTRFHTWIGTQNEDEKGLF